MEQGWLDDIWQGTRDFAGEAGGDAMAVAACDNALAVKMSAAAFQGGVRRQKNIDNIAAHIDLCETLRDEMDTSDLDEAGALLSEGKIGRGLWKIVTNPDDIADGTVYFVGERFPELAGGFGGAAAGGALGGYVEPVSSGTGALFGGVIGYSAANFSKLIGEIYYEKLRNMQYDGFSYDEERPGDSIRAIFNQAARKEQAELNKMVRLYGQEALVEALVETGINASVAFATAGVAHGLEEAGIIPDTVQIMEGVGVDTSQVSKRVLHIGFTLQRRYWGWRLSGKDPKDFDFEGEAKKIAIETAKSAALGAVTPKAGGGRAGNDNQPDAGSVPAADPAPE